MLEDDVMVKDKEELRKQEHYRYERKFFVSELPTLAVESLVRLHPALFSEIYHPRYINNIYLDTHYMQSYFENVSGQKERVKYRIRWYGDMFGQIEKPVLELKIKDGIVMKKESYPLAPLSLDRTFDLETLRGVIRASSVPEKLRLHLIALEPVLLNRYRRKYFLSSDRNFRITVDSHLEYYRVATTHNSFMHNTCDSINTILELKYPSDHDELAPRIVTRFPFRMTKSSKYVDGITEIYAL